MNFIQGARCVVAAALVALVGACGGGSDAPDQVVPFIGWSPSAKSVPSSGNYVYLTSDIGDSVGTGQTSTYTHLESALSVVATGNRLTVNIGGAQQWTGQFQLNSSATSVVRGYSGTVHKYDPAVGGLDWSGPGRACSTLDGWFVVDRVAYVNGELSSVDLRFEQHCGGGTPALRGQVHWSAEDITVASGPVLPVPVGLWAPAAGSTPATGNYIYLVSDPNDFIGQGRVYSFVPANATISIIQLEGRLEVEVATAGSVTWSGQFQSTDESNPLSVGFFSGATRYPFQATGRAGLDWSGDGRGCNTLTGWFSVDNVTYTGGALKSVDLRFKQHCEGLTPALVGKIHWVF